MRHVMTFVGNAVGLTKPYRYQVMELDTLGRVQLWAQPYGGRWEIGHGKDIPVGWTAERTADVMRQYVLEDISHETYNELLPS